jgi:prohibitin 1
LTVGNLKLAAPLLLLPLLAGCAVATIEPGERGVKVNMGQVDKQLIQNGLVTFNPFTTHIYEYSIKQETAQGSVSPLTSDQQPIHISFKVQYRIPEGQLLNLYENVKGDPYEVLAVPQIQESFRQVVAKYKADKITGDVNAIKEQVVALSRQAVGASIFIQDIPITEVNLPTPLQAAIMEKQGMEIQAKKKQYELDRERKEAEITVTKARAQAESTRLMTEALRKSPELVKFKLAEVELEKARKWDGHLPTTMIGGGAHALFNLK